MDVIRYRSVDIVTVEENSVGRTVEYGILSPSWVDFILQNEVNGLEFTSAHAQQDPSVIMQMYPYLINDELFPESNVLRVELSAKFPQNSLLRQVGSLVGGDFVHSYSSTPPVNLTNRKNNNASTSSTPSSSSWQYSLPRETLNAESISRWGQVLPMAHRQTMLSTYNITKKVLHNATWYGVHISTKRRRVRRRTNQTKVDHDHKNFLSNISTTAYRIDLRLSVFIHGSFRMHDHDSSQLENHTSFSGDHPRFQHSSQRIQITDRSLSQSLSTSPGEQQPLIERYLLYETRLSPTVYTILRPFSNPLCQHDCCLLSIIETMSDELNMLPETLQYTRLDISSDIHLSAEENADIIQSARNWYKAAELSSYEGNKEHNDSAAIVSFSLPYCWTNLANSVSLESDCAHKDTCSAYISNKSDTAIQDRKENFNGGEVVVLRYQVRRLFSQSHQLPPDASYGTILLPLTLNINNNAYVAYSSALLLPALIPDRTMPFNILTMVGTLWAFFIGSLLNLYLKKRAAALKSTQEAETRD